MLHDSSSYLRIHVPSSRICTRPIFHKRILNHHSTYGIEQPGLLSIEHISVTTTKHIEYKSIISLTATNRAPKLAAISFSCDVGECMLGLYKTAEFGDEMSEFFLKASIDLTTLPPPYRQYHIRRNIRTLCF